MSRLLTALLTLGLGAICFAQRTTEVSGRVTDASQAVIANATVTVTNVDTRVRTNHPVERSWLLHGTAASSRKLRDQREARRFPAHHPLRNHTGGGSDGTRGLHHGGGHRH